jgi:hypothetical protein
MTVCDRKERITDIESQLKKRGYWGGMDLGPAPLPQSGSALIIKMPRFSGAFPYQFNLAL